MNAKKLLCLSLLLVMLVSTFAFGIVASAENGNVAKVGNTEYATIDEAIANWTNGSTLTLLADVTLSDVIQLSSTEHHILDLGTYTMTAASKKDAIQIVNKGRSDASYTLDIKADAENPGGITASGKAVVRTTGKSGVKDRPIIRFYEGVFTGSNVVYHSGSNGTNCPQFWFYGGEFNGTVYANRAKFIFYGGTFNGSLQMSVDSSADALVVGGTFKQLSNLYGSTLNTDKFTIGSAAGVYDKEVYVDDNGYYVVAAAKPAEGIEAAVAKTPSSNDYFAYSKVKTEGALNYTDVVTALKNNNSTSDKVTIYADEVDMSGINFKGTIVVPAESTLKITNAPATLKVVDENGEALESKNGSYTTVEPQGSNFNAFTSVDGFWGEVWGNASKSFVIKVLDANGNVMGSTSLENIGGIIDGDVHATWYLKLDAASNTDAYWTMEWTVAPSINNMPKTAELWVDGVKVSGGNVLLNGPDNLWPIVAAVVDGDGKILSFATSLQAAIEAVKEGETIVLLSDVTITTPAYGQNALNHARAVSFTLDLNGKTLSADAGNSVFRFNIANTDATENVVVTVKNGTVIAGANTWCALMAAGIDKNAKAVLNLEDLTVKNSKAGDLAIKAWDNALINAENVTVEATNGAGGFYAVGGEIVLDNCTVKQQGLHTAPYLSMAFAVSSGGKMTINSGIYSAQPTAAGEGNNQGTSHGSWVGGVMNSGGTLVINGGTFSNGNFGEDNLATAARGLILADTKGMVEVNGGTFNALKSIFDFQNNLGTTSPVITVKGGTYSADPSVVTSYGSIQIADGYCVADNNGSYAVVEAVVKIGATGYPSLQHAINAAQAGDIITILADLDLVDATVAAGKNIVIDLNGKTITDAYIVVNGDVIIKNGYINNVNEPYPLVVQNGGNLVINDVAIEASKSDRAIWVRSGSSLVFNSGSIRVTKGANNTKTSLIAAIYTDSNTNVTIKGGTITVDTPDNKAIGIFGNYTNANVTVNGGKISTSGKNYSYGINVDGNITVNGGEIVTNEKGYGYSSGIRYGNNYALVSATGNVTITGGTITTNGYSGYIVSVGRSYSSNDQTVTITGGTLTNNLSEVEQTAGGHKAPALIWEASASEVTATITAGNISGFSPALLKGENTDLAVSGGTFDVAINEEYLAAGFKQEQNNDGSYGVVVDPAYGMVAQIGDVYYATVLEALQAAINSGASEIKILADVREKMTGDFDIVISADLTITADSPVKVEFYNDGTNYDFAVGSTNNNTLTIAKNVHFDLIDRVIWIGFFGNNVDVVVNGYLGGHQIWHGADTFVGKTGTLDSHGEAFIMRRNATLTVNGGKVHANYFQIYSGHIEAKDAEITAGLVWINNNHSYGSEGTVSVKLDNTKFASNGEVKVYAGSNKTVDIELTNGSAITSKGAFTTDAATTVVADATSTFTAKNESVFVASVNGVSYNTLANALAAAQSGDEIILLADVAETVTVPAGVIFNGNGKQVGVITAAGEITFKGHTKATNFGTKYTNTTINIIEGACLEITGSDRLVIGHGCTFNITGTIADAKTADKATLTPSLIMPGASFTGAGVTFNVTDAYITAPSSYCSSSKSASGTFEFNIVNSIWENAGKLAFEAQSTAATVNFNLKDSVLNTGSHLVFGVSLGEIVIDNSNVNVGKSNQIENRSTMTIKNGSVVNGAVATSSNATNPGTIIVDNATYAVTGEFSGSNLGTGTLIIKNGATVSAGSITKANIQIDATNMQADDVINLTANLSNLAGNIEVVNNNKLEANIVDGKVVLKRILPGAGTETNPYIIEDLSDLILFRDSVNAGETRYNAPGVYVALAANIDMAGIDWSVNIGDGANATFDGIFDGKDHIISNLTGAESALISDGYVCTGLFGAIYGEAVIKNLIIDNANITAPYAGNNAGILVGFAWSATGSIEKVTIINSSINATGIYGVGAIVGYAHGGDLTITGCKVESITINAASGAGAVIGYANNAKVVSCSVKNVEIKAQCLVGGIAGIANPGFMAQGSKVENVTLTVSNENWVNSKGIVLGGMSGNGIVITDTESDNVNATAIVGSQYAEHPTSVVPAVEAHIGGKYYNTLQDALAAAQVGDVITIIADVSDVAIEVNKNLTITGSVTLNNVSINATGADALTVSGLNFTGNSWINSGTAESLTVSGVTANVTPSNSAYTNSRSAFISLGSKEAQMLELVVENSNIVVSGGANPILGWASITSATITGNTFGSASAHQNNSDSVKFMAIADGAVFTITGNTVYSDYNGFVFGQNTTRGNAYTVNLEGNTFFGVADHVWMEVSGSNTIHATVNASSNNTVNKKAFTVADIKVSSKVTNWTSYAGVDVVTDANGKVIGGKLASFSNKEVLADGYALRNGVVVCLAGSGTEADPFVIGTLADLILFRDSVNAGEIRYNASGVYVVLVADIDLSSVENWAPIGNFDYSFDGNFNGQSYKIMNLKMSDNTAVNEYAYLGFFGVTAYNTIENLVIENVTIQSNGQIVAAAIAYPYYTTVNNITVCGNIAIEGGNYTAGVLAYTRLCVNASNLTVSGNAGSYISGKQVVGGVIADIQMNHGLVANYSNFSVSGVKITGDKMVGGISGIIATQDLNGATVKNVTLESRDGRVGIVAGSFGGTCTIANVTAQNVEGATAIIGGSYDSNVLPTRVNDTYYATFAEAFAATQNGDVITLYGDIETDEVILIDKDITINGNNHKITSSASRVIRITASNIEVTLNNVDLVSKAVRVGTNDVRGISIDASLNKVKLYLNNSSVDFTDPSANDWAYAINVCGNGSGHKVVIDSGSYEGANVINVHGANNTVVVKNATLTCTYPNSDMYAGACIWVLQNQGSSVEATGNTFNGANAIAFNLGTGTALTESNNQDNTTVPVAKIGNAYYVTLADAFAAAQNGDTIVLLANIALDAGITNTKKVTLNLNGKTITGTDNATGSFGLITNKGELTITGNGKITLVATQNRGWNAYSSVISNQVGGKLIVENGTIEHLGGTDMAYAIDNLTNGKGTYAETVINGGVIKSTYRAIRQFLNGVDAQNILTVTGGTIQGANKSIWMQDPSKNANTGTLTVGASAAIKGDIYLSVTAGSTEWPVEISIADAALQGDSTVLTNNVPEDLAMQNVNGTWGKVSSVASINRVGYATLAEAVAAANAGDTIVLLDDVVLSETLVIPADKSITLNLNGKTISQVKECTASYEMIANNGALTITGNGKISFTDTGAGDPNAGWGVYTIRNSGTLVIENGTIENLSAQNKAGQAFAHTTLAIFQYSGSTTINGGTISTPNYRSVRLWSGELTINGGTFEGQVWVHCVNDTSVLTINGGSFAPRGNDGSSVFVNNAGKVSALTVNGGYFSTRIGSDSPATLGGGLIAGGTFSAAAVQSTNSALLAEGMIFGEPDANGDCAVVDDPTTHYINNLDDLKAFRDAVNAGNTFAGVTVYLNVNIDLANENWTPIGTSTNPFCGMFDGQNNVISNLLIEGDKNYVSGADNDNYKGFFGYMKGGNTAGIKNLNINNAKVTGCLYVGAILGRSYTGGIIDNCHVYGLVQIDGYAYIGGIVGRHEYSADANHIAIRKCSVDGKVLVTVKARQSNATDSYINADYAVSYVGGIVGFVAEGKYIIDGCSVANVDVSGVYGVGGISGIGHYGNEITDASVSGVTVTSTGNDKESARTDNVGLIVGATQGTASQPTIIKDVAVQNTSASVTYTDNTTEEITTLYGTNMNGSTPVTNYVAEVGGVQYENFADALAAAKTMTGDVVVKIFQKVTLNSDLSGNFDSIAFIGEGEYAEIYLDVQGYITAPGKKVSFADLKLSKVAGGYMGNAGFMNVAFGIYDVAEVNYTNCVFLNGAYASSGNVTYTGCTFYRSHDKYSLWAYGDVDVTVNGCTFADYRGIKMYAEGAAKTVNLTVKNSDFSALTGKPAIVLTYGESVTLAGNTYSETGVFELDLGGAPNGTPVTSTDRITCVNDNGACGVLANGKIYTTLLQAVEASSTGSTVTLLHNTDEDFVLPAGITLNKNGYTAENVKEAVAQIGNVPYASLLDALAAARAGDVIVLHSDITLDAVVSIEKAITLDLNDKTVTGADGAIVFNVKADATIKNGSIKGNKSGTSSGLIDIYANLVLNGVNIETSKINALSFKAGGLTATLTDCNVVGAFKGYGASVWNIVSGTYKASSTAINDQLNGTASISGGIFHYEIAAEECAPGYAVVDNGNGTYGVKYAPVAFVDANNNGTFDEGEALYGSLNAIFKNHRAGNVYIVLTGNVTVNKQVDADVDAKYYLNTNVAEGVVVNFAFADDWNFIQNMQIGENVTVNAKYLYIWGEVEVSGTVNTDYFYMHGATVTVTETGVVNATTGEATVQVKDGTTFTVKGKVNTAILNVWVNDAKLVVDGANAKVKASWIDIWDGTPSVNIENGAIVETNSIKVSRGGEIALNDGNLNATTVVLGHDRTSAGILTEAGNSTVNGEIKMTTTNSIVNSDGGLNVTTEIDDHKVIFENGQYKVVAKIYVAQVGANKYESLQEALNAAVAGDEVKILLAGEYKVPSGKNLTITGAVDGVVFTNIGAHNMGGASMTFNNVTFNYGNENYRGLQHSGNLVYNNCTFNGQVFLYGESDIFNNCTFNQTSSDAYNVWTYGSKKVEFNGCTFNSAGKSVLIYHESASVYSEVSVVDSTFNAISAVDGKAAIEMDSSLTAGIKLTIDAATTATGFGVGNVSGNSLWNNKKGNNTDANNDITVSVDGQTVLAPVTFVAKIGQIGYTSLEEAFKAATAGCTIDIVKDVVIDYKWDARNTGAKFTVPVTIDGNGHTIKFTNTVYDAGNHLSAFRFEADATVVDLTIDMSEAISGFAGRFRAISAKGNLTVDGCTFIGNGSANNTRAIIFGEGAGANAGNLVISITNSKFTGWSRAISDNENAQDVKSVVITGNTISDADVYVSATDSITFSDNAMDDGFVNIKSYTAPADLEVLAQNNVLETNSSAGGNYIHADPANVTADSGFALPVAKAGNKFYATLADAFAAAQNGDTIVLLADIALDAGITNTKKVTLDLNGKTITGTDNATGSFGLITNKGELTITGNGKMTLVAINDRDWNAYSSVISNTVGGKLIVESGTIEHLGGTDMAYAIDNLTNGKGTYAETVIEGGVIKSTYRAIRQFLNGVEAQNILTVNGGTIEGANKSIWMQDPSANANTGKLTVGENAAINGDIYLTVTAGSTVWPVEVSINASALKNGSTVLTSNVPEHLAVAESNGVWGIVKSVASINGVGYASLQAAIDAATAGDTIKLLGVVNENVTVGKSLTIDGANFNYTGGISVKGKANTTVVTVKNVNFIGGANYAITTNKVKSITVENCTSTGYSYGFLYANKTTPTVVMKNVIVTGGNYGFHWAYGTSATLENVIMTNVTNGLYIQNYASKTITLKNCEISSIGIWERSGYAGVQTFKFEGANTVGTLTESQYAKYVLNAIDATLKAPEGDFTVTVDTDHPCYKVEHENGIYKAILAHTVVIVPAKAPTCTETGLTTGAHCSECGEVLVAQQEVPATGVHTWVDATVDAPKTCTVCGATEGDKAVASVGGKYYTSIQAAVDAAQNGDTVKVLADIELVWDRVTLVDNSYAAIVRVAGKSITIDLNGKTLTGNSDTWATNKTVFAVFAADEGGKLTLTGNGTVEVTGQTAVYSLIMAYENGTYITIENGNYYLETATAGGSLLYAGGGDTLMTVNGGNFELGNVGTGTNGSPWIINVYGQNNNYVVVNGGTFNADICHQFWANEVFVDGEKYALQSNVDEGTWSIVSAVAYIEKIGVSTNSQYRFVGYATIEEALAAAKAGDTITLVKDIALENGIVISANQEITIDLAGHTMSMDVAATAASALITNNGALTITDSSAEQTGKLTYHSSTTSTGYSTSTIINNGVLTVEGGTIVNTSASGASYAVDNYNTLTVNGGNFVAKRNVIRQAQFGNYDNTVTINGGTFGTSGTSTSYAGLQLHVFNNVKKTQTVINGGIFNGTYAMYTSFSTADASANTAITINDGTFNGDYALFLYNSKAGAVAFTASVNGGTFNGSVYVYVNDASGESINLPVISGGVFSEAVDETLCAEGFIPVDNGNGTYGVEEGQYLVEVGDNKYGTLEEAKAAAGKGETVTLLSEVTYEGYLILDGITLDLNGHNLTVNGALIALKGSSIVDSQNGTGKLFVSEQNSLVLSDVEYPMLPVWMTNHYVFVEVTPQLTVTALGNDSFNIKFRPGVINSAYTDSIFKNGAADNGLTIEIFVHCYKYDENGVRVEVEELHFVLTDDYIAKTYTELSPDGNKLAFGLTIKGATAKIADEYVVSYAVRSNRGVSYLVAEETKYTFKPTAPTGAEN